MSALPGVVKSKCICGTIDQHIVTPTAESTDTATASLLKLRKSGQGNEHDLQYIFVWSYIYQG